MRDRRLVLPPVPLVAALLHGPEGTCRSGIVRAHLLLARLGVHTPGVRAPRRAGASRLARRLRAHGVDVLVDCCGAGADLVGRLAQALEVPALPLRALVDAPGPLPARVGEGQFQPRTPADTGSGSVSQVQVPLFSVHRRCTASASPSRQDRTTRHSPAKRSFR